MLRRWAVAATFLVALVEIVGAQRPRSRYEDVGRDEEKRQPPKSRYDDVGREEERPPSNSRDGREDGEKQQAWEAALSQDLTGEARKWIVGRWRSHGNAGNFVLAVSSDGRYTYSHKNRMLAQVADHSGTWVIALSNRTSESVIRPGMVAWTAVDGAVGRRAQGAGLMITMTPGQIRVRSSYSPLYLGNDPVSFRITFDVDERRATGFKVLHIDQNPNDDNGVLRFTRE